MTVSINFITLVVIWLLQATLVEEGASFHCYFSCSRRLSSHHQLHCEGRGMTLPAWQTKKNASTDLYEPTSRRGLNKTEVNEKLYCLYSTNAYVISHLALYFASSNRSLYLASILHLTCTIHISRQMQQQQQQSQPDRQHSAARSTNTKPPKAFHTSSSSNRGSSSNTNT